MDQFGLWLGLLLGTCHAFNLRIQGLHLYTSQKSGFKLLTDMPTSNHLDNGVAHEQSDVDDDGHP